MQRLSQNLQVGTEAHKFKPWRVGGKGDYLKTELVVDDQSVPSAAQPCTQKINSMREILYAMLTKKKCFYFFLS